MHDDQTLIQCIALGDQEALHTLHSLYYKHVYRYLWYQLEGDTSLIDEVVQDVFMAVWQSAVTFRAESHVLTWIMRIAHNMGCRAIRRNHAKKSQWFQSWLNDISPDSEEESWSENSPENTVIDRMVLLEALNHLSAKHREIIDLVFQYGFTPEEVATILSIPIGTVRSRISYARKSLAWYLVIGSAQENISCQSD
jgi:RNA polymerase sigma-70 factor (ECF subfamily)